VSARADVLRAQLRLAGEVEALFARGAFAARTDAGPVQVDGPGARGARFELLNARHPLLAWAAASAQLEGEEPEPVVPNDILFGDRHALVITGPNAGGKTVALKTVGLCALLTRAGMPIPASPDSRLPLCVAVLPVIGDQQSLADALSSFSGHLEALREVLEATAAQASRGPVLCLLDELASGTDPGQGAAIAQAVLESVVGQGAHVVATTHYERLKLLGLDEAASNPFRNASLALDGETHTPTFRLRLDVVGTSNALDAARRHHLPQAVIERAEELLAPEEKGLNDALSGLANKRAELEARVEKLEQERARVEQEPEARRTVAEAIESAQRGADARELNERSHALRDVEREVEQLQAEQESTAGEDAPEVNKGDRVLVAHMPGATFEVVEVHGDEVVVANGPMRLRAERSSLQLARGGGGGGKRSAAKSSGKKKAALTGTDPRTKDNTLDLRGERVGDGIEMLEAFLDRLLREGRSRGYVLHGHGTGAMKRAVRDAARESRYVKSSGPAHHDDGGDAVTIVELADARL
jgi:DNA mismatch repair protein MutS2